MPSEAVDVDRGQFVGRRLSRVAFVVGLHELSPVGRRAASRRDGRWFERFAEMCQGLTSRGRSHPGLLPLANLRFEVSRLLPAVSSASDVATTPRALERKLLPHPRHEFRPRNPGGVVGGRFVARVAAVGGRISARRMSADRTPISRGIPPLADIPDGECRDGGLDEIGPCLTTCRTMRPGSSTKLPASIGAHLPCRTQDLPAFTSFPHLGGCFN
jgi:hypothetical protein